jgi:ubiquinone/menaquinone biosynthesis C-methylase UbiE
MNYGYIDSTPPDLNPDDEPYRLFIQLYEMNIRDTQLTDSEVLEVGSGRGGGASWIAKSLHPSTIVGVQFSSEAVSLCNKWYNHQKNLKFIEGNAENLPFENSSFDVIYNVESSHCYGNMGKFVDEVFRVLRKGGTFCWTDFRDNKSMQFTNQIFLESGFTIVSKREITNEVLDALDSINDAKKERIEELVPKSIRRSFETFAGVEGTPVYDAFKNEKLKYFCFQMIK